MAFVCFESLEGFLFNDLIDSDNSIHGDEKNKDLIFTGAWANILLKGDTITDAISVIPLGLKELNFKIRFIDKVEYLPSKMESDELNQIHIEEALEFGDSTFNFKIADRIFPFVN